jgi:hypothetical protein
VIATVNDPNYEPGSASGTFTGDPREYTHNHSIAGISLTSGAPSDNVTTNPGGNFNYNKMEFLWTEGSGTSRCIAEIITFGPASYVTDSCTSYSYGLNDITGHVTATEINSTGVGMTTSTVDFTLKAAPEFGQIGPAISIFLVGAFYVYFRKRAFNK